MSDGPLAPAGKATDVTQASPPARGPEPAADLAGVWDLLDALPRASPVQISASRLTATTLQMAAVAAGAPVPGSGRRLRRDSLAWLTPAAVVAVALLTGVAAGRLTAPSGDARLVDELPYVAHLDLLREAGSVRFLEALTTREQQPPQRFLRPGMEAAEREADEFRARLTALVTDAGTDRAARRDRVADLSLEERVELEKAARTFARLSGTERQALGALATALADPARDDLREAAVTWHLWLQPVRPEDRERVIASGTDKRLEWIEWYASRMDGRMRPGFFERPPGGGPPRGEGFPSRGDGPPRGDGESRNEGPPRGEGQPRGEAEPRNDGEPRGDGRGAPPDDSAGDPRPLPPEPGFAPRGPAPRGADADGQPTFGPRRPPFPGGLPPGYRPFGPPRVRPDGPPPEETRAAPS